MKIDVLALKILYLNSFSLINQFGFQLYLTVVLIHAIRAMQLLILLTVFLLIAGSWLGFWVVRKLVLSEDGSIDVGVSHFVTWSIRIVSSVLILQVFRFFHIYNLQMYFAQPDSQCFYL